MGDERGFLFDDGMGPKFQVSMGSVVPKSIFTAPMVSFLVDSSMDPIFMDFL